jgi:hypothetical protein
LSSFIPTPDVGQAIESARTDWEALKSTFLVMGLSEYITFRGLEVGFKFAADFAKSNPQGFLRAAKATRGVSQGWGIFSLGFSFYIAREEGWKTTNVIDIVGDGFAVVFAVFGLGWFAGNLISEMFTGKSLSENFVDIFTNRSGTPVNVDIFPTLFQFSGH